MAIMGAVLDHGNEVYGKIINYGWNPDWIFSTKLRQVWDVIEKMAVNFEAIDIVTVAQRMKGDRNCKSDSLFLEQCIARAFTIAHLYTHIDLVKEAAERRMILSESDKLKELLHSNMSTDEIIAVARYDFYHMRAGRSPRTVSQIFDDIERTHDAARTKSAAGIPHRWMKLQFLTGGWPSKYCVLAGWPSHGKSTFMRNDVFFAAQQGKKIGVVTLEETEEEFWAKLAAELSGVNLFRLRSGWMNDREFQVARDLFRKARYEIQDLPIRVTSRARTCHQAVAWMLGEECDAYWLDYIQNLRRGPNDPVKEYDRVTEHSNMLCDLASDKLRKPVIVLSQFSRPPSEGRRKGAGRPTLQMLKGSGSLEQDAHMAILLYQDPEAGEELIADNAPSIVEVAKYRGGRIGKVDMTFIKSALRFVETPKEQEIE